jgi:hypothetical protein
MTRVLTKSISMKMSLRERWKRLSLWTKLGVIGSVASIIGVALYFVPTKRAPDVTAAVATGISSQGPNNVSNSKYSPIVQAGDVSGGTVIGVVSVADEKSPERKQTAANQLRGAWRMTRPSLESFTRDVRQAGQSISFDSAPSVSSDIQGMCEPLEESLHHMSKVIEAAKGAGIIDADSPAGVQIHQLCQIVVSLRSTAKGLVTLASRFEAQAASLEAATNARNSALWLHRENYQDAVDQLHAERERTIAKMTELAGSFDKLLPDILKAIDAMVDKTARDTQVNDVTH